MEGRDLQRGQYGGQGCRGDSMQGRDLQRGQYGGQGSAEETVWREGICRGDSMEGYSGAKLG